MSKSKTKKLNEPIKLGRSQKGSSMSYKKSKYKMKRKDVEYNQDTLTRRLDSLEAYLFRDFPKGTRVKTSFSAISSNIFKKHRTGVVVKDSAESSYVVVRVFPNKKASMYSKAFWDWK